MVYGVKVPQGVAKLPPGMLEKAPRRTKPTFNTLSAVACITQVPLAFRRLEGFQKTVKAGIATKSRQDVIKA